MKKELKEAFDRYEVQEYTKYAIYDYETNDYLRDESGDIKLMSQTDANMLRAELNDAEEKEEDLFEESFVAKLNKQIKEALDEE